jgi:hypothetical protein
MSAIGVVKFATMAIGAFATTALIKGNLALIRSYL